MSVATMTLEQLEDKKTDLEDEIKTLERELRDANIQAERDRLNQLLQIKRNNLNRVERNIRSRMGSAGGAGGIAETSFMGSGFADELDNLIHGGTFAQDMANQFMAGGGLKDDALHIFNKGRKIVSGALENPLVKPLADKAIDAGAKALGDMVKKRLLGGELNHNYNKLILT